MMQDHEIERTALRLTQKYGRKALPKAVEVVKYYLNEDDDANAKRWVSIGYAVKRIQQIESVKDAIAVMDEAVQ